jgi:hypothetical protein
MNDDSTDPFPRSDEDLAGAMRIPLSTLRWLARHREADRDARYWRWNIPKRNGTTRTITAPKPQTEAAQGWARNALAPRLDTHDAAHGFRLDRSIVTNARVHAGCDVLVKIDLRDFFPSITWRRVEGLLRARGVAPGATKTLAMLTTEAPRKRVNRGGEILHVATGPRSLPQGASTSPALSNAVCRRMDRRLTGLARSLDAKYTRYADDLAFSFTLAPETRAPVARLLSRARKIIRAEGFRVNPSKIQVQRKGERQHLTGLVINAAPEGVAVARVPREEHRRIRAALHNHATGRHVARTESLKVLEGRIAFVNMVDPVQGARLKAALDAVRTAKGARK